MKKKVRQVLGGLAVFGILVLLGAAGMGIAIRHWSGRRKG